MNTENPTPDMTSGELTKTVTSLVKNQKTMIETAEKMFQLFTLLEERIKNVEERMDSIDNLKNVLSPTWNPK